MTAAGGAAAIAADGGWNAGSWGDTAACCVLWQARIDGCGIGSAL